jgi:hypothetical protein
MTPREVNGLQSLAQAHGGSLTTNPHTGLPEAGFLDSLLPTIAGFALDTFAPGLGEAVGDIFGASGAVGTGLLVGGVGGLATGSLGKGLMMGLGAYGGAGLADSLANAGATNASDQLRQGVTEAANPNVQLTGNSQTLTGPQLQQQIANTYATPETVSPLQISQGAQVPSQSLSFPNASNASSLQAAQNQLAATGTSPQMIPGSYYSNDAAIAASDAAPTAADAATAPSKFDNIRSGFGNVTDSFKSAGQFVKENKWPLIAAAVPTVVDAMTPTPVNFSSLNAAGSKGHVRPFAYNSNVNESAFVPTTSSAERRFYSDPRFTALPMTNAKEGGLMSLAVGGPVETMSAQNAVGDNMMYPQAGIQTAMYSNPMVQRPIAENVIKQGVDTNVDPYTGEQKMAEGGSTSYTYDPATMKYTGTTTPVAQDTSYGGLAKSALGIGSGVVAQLLQQMKNAKSTQPSVVGSTTGGISTPYTPTGLAAANTSMVPNIPMQPQQSVDQQLGLQAFYPMMEQQLAMKGAQMQGRRYADGGMAKGGYNLGGYSDGGRLLKGPGDGVSDSIPAQIGNHQPARLANNEFVIPARIVSEIGNGSTDAGAKRLYEMMDRVQKRRSKTVGKNKVAVDSGAHKELARL